MSNTALDDAIGPTGLTRDAWARLLRALDPDSVRAGSRYEQLRHQLIALYRGRALPDAEGLADEAFDRLARGLAGEPGAAGTGREVGAALHRVARELADDARRLRRDQAIALAALPHAAAPPALPAPPAWHDRDDPLAQLVRCLDELPRLEHRTLVEYEAGADDDRCARRRALADELGIPISALRVRVHRLRARLMARMAAKGAMAAPAARPAPPRVPSPGARVRSLQLAVEPVPHREPVHMQPQQLAGIDAHAERRRRLLVIADRLQRGAGRATQQRGHQAEPPRVEPQGHPAGGATSTT
jgi:DNA-directed RNA polymerase specialized sigma24 family protein